MKRANLAATLSSDALITLQGLPSPTWQDLATAGLKISPRVGRVQRGDFAVWLLQAQSHDSPELP